MQHSQGERRDIGGEVGPSGADDSAPLRLAEPRFGPEAIAAIEEVLASGQLTQGPKVEAFEQAVAAFCGTANGVATTSATTALELVLASLDIGPGDEVIVADFTYPATANAVLQRSAQPRLVDVDAETYCIDIDAVVSALNPQTAAVIAVDAFGLPADYAALEDALAAEGLPLICDAACALGGAIGDRRCGSFGLASAFSFHPRKSLATGEGGMVTTQDDELARRMRRLRNHGSERVGWRARFIEPGFNFRMSEINAALGLVQVDSHLKVVERRRELARHLTSLLTDVEGVEPQRVPPARLHPYQAYVVTLEPTIDRDLVIAELGVRGIESTLGTYALHAEPAFERACGTRPGDLPRSHRLMQQTLALPLHQRLRETDLSRIAAALHEVLPRC